MIRFITTACCALALAFSSVPVNADPKGGHVMILLDVSQSNPLVDDASHAARVASDVDALLSSLTLGDRITVTTFGEYDVRKNKVMEKDVTTRFRPETARRSIRDLIAGIPDAVKSGNLTAQGSTNMVAALDMTARRVDCGSRRTQVIVASDGRENSEHGRLPTKPANPSFAGCESMTIIGLTAESGSETNKIAAAWDAWCHAAGFKFCKARE